mmetsp:Transcript_439/g.1305  ORF Transcript_439/g.1305 Transcript_439/m.1305 type:complete len:250 (+) Transcript_439:1201-1950(+)
MPPRDCCSSTSADTDLPPAQERSTAPGTTTDTLMVLPWGGSHRSTGCRARSVMLELSRQRAAPKLPVLPKLRFRRLKLPRGPVLPRSGIPAAGPQLPLPPGARDRVPEPPRGEPPPPPPLSLSYPKGARRAAKASEMPSMVAQLAWRLPMLARGLPPSPSAVAGSPSPAATRLHSCTRPGVTCAMRRSPMQPAVMLLSSEASATASVASVSSAPAVDSARLSFTNDSTTSACSDSQGRAGSAHSPVTPP